MVVGCAADKLHLLVAATLGQRPRPFAIGLTFWPLRRPRGVISVRLDLYEARPALHAQVIARIVVELEGRNEAVGRVARIGALRFACGGMDGVWRHGWNITWYMVE